MAKAPVPTYTPPAATPKTKGYAWEAALADALSIPYSANVKKFFDAWHSADNSKATNNPFNITVDYTGKATGDLGGNTAHVKNFSTPLDGIKATAAFIAKNTPNLIDIIKNGDFKAASNYLQAAHWAGSSTTYGAAVYKNYVNGTYTQGNNAPVNLSPAAKAQVAAQAATLAAEAKLGSAGYVDATAALSGAVAQAKAVQHVADPWVTVTTTKNGTVKLGQATGYAPPKNVLTYGGEPVTKSALSSIWTSAYASTYEQYTGKVATTDVVVKTLQAGLSPFGLRAQLANQKGFVDSPIYKQSAGAINNVSRQILGIDAPTDIVKKALVENWDAQTLQNNLRKTPQYLKGPEYQTNVAQMGQVYKTIYGTPDAGATQTIRETAANGWTTDQFANYLRTQPQYKTSVEYESKAVGFLGAMGLLVGARPTLQPGVKGVGGGTAVPDASNVPGTARPLGSVLDYTPTLGDSKLTQGLAVTP